MGELKAPSVFLNSDCTEKPCLDEGPAIFLGHGSDSLAIASVQVVSRSDNKPH